MTKKKIKEKPDLISEIGYATAFEMNINLPVVTFREFIENLYKSATVRSLLREAIRRAEIKAYKRLK